MSGSPLRRPAIWLCVLAIAFDILAGLLFPLSAMAVGLDPLERDLAVICSASTPEAGSQASDGTSGEQCHQGHCLLCPSLNKLTLSSPGTDAVLLAFPATGAGWAALEPECGAVARTADDAPPRAPPGV